MATNKQTIGFQYGKNKYFFRHVVDKGYESFRLEGFNGELIIEKPATHLLFENWVLEQIQTIMSKGN